MVYNQGEIAFRQIDERDKPLLVKWLSDSEILAYYEGRDRPFDLELINEHFYRKDDGITRCIILYEKQEIGFIQFYLVDEESANHYRLINFHENIYGMDQFIGEVDYWNRGIGQLVVKSMVSYLIEERNARKIVMDPQAWNKRAIACYEKCGFEKVKLLPKNEYHEGEYRDCWLMEYKKN